MALAVIIIIMILILGLGGFYFSSIVIKPKTFDYDDTYNFEIEHGRFEKDVFEKLDKDEVYIKSPYGYDLHGLFFPAAGSKKAVIICHGITYTLYGSVKYMDVFIQRGYNVLIYDHRNHGRSGGNYTTFGYYEKYDLKACMDWIKEKLGDDCIAGVHGESMGAGISLQYAAIDSRADFIIADCAYSDLNSLLKIRLKEDYHLPPFPILNIASFISRLRCGINYQDVSPIKEISEITTPILFIHGSEDRYIPNTMSRDMYNSKKISKKIYIAPDAGHAQSINKNKEAYEKIVNDFLDEYKL
jgi:fermentation-respiration switch protein FrsA (DUF1100 family)